MPVEIREILLQAQVSDEERGEPRRGEGLDEERLQRFRAELLEEVRRLIRDELDRRARR